MEDDQANGAQSALAQRARAFLDRLPLAREGGRQLRRLPEGGVVGDWFGCELSFVLRNYRNNGFQVAINVESPMQWQALSGRMPAQFVKVDSARLFIAEDWRACLEWLVSLREGAHVVVTRLERKLDGVLPEEVFAQGYAYGLPTPRAAITRAQRYVLDRFAC